MTPTKNTVLVLNEPVALAPLHKLGYRLLTSLIPSCFRINGSKPWEPALPAGLVGWDLKKAHERITDALPEEGDDPAEFGVVRLVAPGKGEIELTGMLLAEVDAEDVALLERLLVQVRRAAAHEPGTAGLLGAMGWWIEKLPGADGPGDVVVGVERALALLTRPADADTELLTALVRQAGPGGRVVLTEDQYAAYLRTFDAMLTATLGPPPGGRPQR